MNEIKHCVITYTENNQHHEVIWHALSVEDAMQSMEASYIDPSDFAKVSNIKVYEVIESAEITRLLSLVEGQAQTITELRSALENAANNLEGLYRTDAARWATMDVAQNYAVELTADYRRLLASTAPSKDGQGDTQ